MRFHTLQKMIQKSRGNRKEIMEKIKELTEQKLKKYGLIIDVIAREKHVYGLYKKMKLKEFKFSQIE